MPHSSSKSRTRNKASKVPFSHLLALWVPAFPPLPSPLSCLHFLYPRPGLHTLLRSPLSLPQPVESQIANLAHPESGKSLLVSDCNFSCYKASLSLLADGASITTLLTFCHECLPPHRCLSSWAVSSQTLHCWGSPRAARHHAVGDSRLALMQKYYGT